MKHTKGDMNKLEELAKPLIKLLNDKYDPHCKIIVNSASVELVGVEIFVPNEEFIKD